MGNDNEIEEYAGHVNMSYIKETSEKSVESYKSTRLDVFYSQMTPCVNRFRKIRIQWTRVVQRPMFPIKSRVALLSTRKFLIALQMSKFH